MRISLLGWIAAGVFAASYFFREAKTLTRIQAGAACIWIIYGVGIGAVPVVVANLGVAGAALFSSFRGSYGKSSRESCDVEVGLVEEERDLVLEAIEEGFI